MAPRSESTYGFQAKNSKVMKLKTPGLRGGRSKAESRALYSPLPHWAPHSCPLPTARAKVWDSVKPPSTPHAPPGGQRAGHLPQSLGPCRAPQPARRCEGWRNPWGTGCHCQGDGVASQALSSALLPPTPSSSKQKPRPLSHMGPKGSHHPPFSPGAWLPEPVWRKAAASPIDPSSSPTPFQRLPHRGPAPRPLRGQRVRGSETDRLRPGLWSSVSPTHKAGETPREASNEAAPKALPLAQTEGVGSVS